MFCTSCGAEIAPNAGFCSQCGAAVAPTVADGSTAGAPSGPRASEQSAQSATIAGDQSVPKVQRAPAALAGGALVVGGLFFLWWLGVFGPPSPKYPEAYGLYVWNGGQWAELGPDKTSITLEFPGDIKFLIHDKAIDRVAKSFQLMRKVFVRNVITQNPDGSGKKIERFRKWDVKGEDVVEGRLSAVKKEPEMVTWAPVAPLAAGIYEPKLAGDSREAFTVSKQAVLANLELSDLCYDRRPNNGLRYSHGRTRSVHKLQIISSSGCRGEIYSCRL